MHGAVVRGTFCFWRMNPLAGIGVSIARNCSETQIFGENCRKHRAKRSFWKHCSMKFGGSLARNHHFGSFFCENCRTTKYYSVLQSTTPVLLRTTKYYSTTTKYYSSTTPYYKVLLRTTKYYSSTTPYYKVLLQYYSNTALYYKVYYSSTTPYYKALLQNVKRRQNDVLPEQIRTTPVLQKLPKRAFRARLPQLFKEQACKTSISCEASSKFHRASFQNARFARCFRQFS